MRFPDFNDFRATITSEKMKEIVQKINEADIHITATNGELQLNPLLSAAASQNTLICLALIEEYHYWLSSQQKQ